MIQTLSEIKDTLDSGAPALLPTETVWGIAARADMEAGVDAIFATKGRRYDKPLAGYWPGPLTIVVPAGPTTTLDPRCFGRASERRTLALRCPDVPWREALCEQPLALTSANPSGAPETHDRDAACAALPGVAALSGHVEDASGLPSTIVAVLGAEMRILRQGGLIVTGVSTY